MFANLMGFLGNQPINLNEQSGVAVAAHQTGLKLDALDPYWGRGEFVYARASGAVRAYGAVTLASVSTALGFETQAVEIPNTPNFNKTVAVSLVAVADQQFGWFQIAGTVPIQSNASVAASAQIGVAATGRLGAVAAGKTILGAVVVLPGTTTSVKTGCTGRVGSTKLIVPNTSGWFPGLYLSGTGIAAATTVLKIDETGREVTLSAALTAAPGSVTATYNNATIFYNVVSIDHCIMQGPIT